VSEEARDLIKGMLTKDPFKRLTAANALDHAWLNMADSTLSDRSLDSSLHEFKIFHGQRKVYTAVYIDINAYIYLSMPVCINVHLVCLCVCLLYCFKIILTIITDCLYSSILQERLIRILHMEDTFFSLL
jgi:serine/threonine protein kinase